MKEAQYLHSTLYVFDADARTEVIARFNDAVKDTSIRCWYDGKQDVSSFEKVFAKRSATRS